MEQKITDELGKYFKQARKDCQYALRDVQKICVISNSFLSQIERGHRLPGLQMFIKLCLVYDVPQRDIERMLLVLKIKLYPKIKESKKNVRL